MNTQSIVITVLVVLLVAPSAMAAHRQESPEVWKGYTQKLEAGAFLQVRMKDGTKVKGYFIPSSGETLRLKPKTRIPVPIRDFQFSEIESIDRKGDSFWSPGMKVLTGTGIGLGTAMLILLGLYAAGG